MKTTPAASWRPRPSCCEIARAVEVSDWSRPGSPPLIWTSRLNGSSTPFTRVEARSASSRAARIPATIVPIAAVTPPMTATARFIPPAILSPALAPSRPARRFARLILFASLVVRPSWRSASRCF